MIQSNKYLNLSGQIREYYIYIIDNDQVIPTPTEIIWRKSDKDAITYAFNKMTENQVAEVWISGKLIWRVLLSGDDDAELLGVTEQWRGLWDQGTTPPVSLRL